MNNNKKNKKNNNNEQLHRFATRKILFRLNNKAT